MAMSFETSQNIKLIGLLTEKNWGIQTVVADMESKGTCLSSHQLDKNSSLLKSSSKLFSGSRLSLNKSS